MNPLELLQDFGTNAWFYGVVFLLVLSILVFVHEMGHYLVARWCGVRVEVFSIGFGKEIWGRNGANGTRWKVSLIPLGGYVKLYGDVDPASAKHIDIYKDEKTGQVMHRDSETGKSTPFTEKDQAEAFFAKKLWQRAAIVFAGPAINYIFAIIILTGLFAFSGQPVTPPSAAGIIVGSSADRAGFEPHDLVLEIDGKEIKSFEEVRRAMMIGLDTERHFKVQRGQSIVDIYASPDKITDTDHFGFEHSRGLLGLVSPQQAVAISSIRKIGTTSFEEGTDVALIRAALLKDMDKFMRVEIDRGEKMDALLIFPLMESNENLNDPESENHNYLILSSADETALVHYALPRAFIEAINESIEITAGTLEALGQMVIGTRSATELGGIVRIGALAGDMAKQGLLAIIFFTALLSINLGFINLMPIPLLDGGHLLFYFFEGILGKPVPDQVQEYAFRGGLAFLVCVMAFANLNDLVQLIL